MPRTVKKAIASAASRTRKRRVNAGRDSSGNATDQPHVRSRCQHVPGTRITGNAKPSWLALASVSSRSM
jgi:hypothetical protein